MNVEIDRKRELEVRSRVQRVRRDKVLKVRRGLGLLQKHYILRIRTTSTLIF